MDLTILVEGVERPAVAEPEPAEDLRDVGGRARGRVVLGRSHEHRWSPRVGLDVPRVVAEAPERFHVVHDQPGRAGDRNLGQHPEQYDNGPAQSAALWSSTGRTASLARFASPL